MFFEVDFYSHRDINASAHTTGCVHAYCLKRLLLSKGRAIFDYALSASSNNICPICGMLSTHQIDILLLRVCASNTVQRPYHRDCLLKVLELDNPVEMMILAGYA